MSAGIPPTARGYSSGVSIVTAHSEGCEFNKNWIELLKIKNHTTIVLMGLTQAENILNEAVLKRIDLSTPLAIVSNATRINQNIVITTLANINNIKDVVEKPALLVFGNVVHLSKILSTSNKYREKLIGEINT